MRGKYFFCVLILLLTTKIIISSSGTITTEAINVLKIISNISTNAIVNKNDTSNYKKIHSIWSTINKFRSNLYEINEPMENIHIPNYVIKLNEERIENIFNRIQFLREITEQWSRLLMNNKHADLGLLTIDMISDGRDYSKSLVAQLRKIIIDKMNVSIIPNEYDEPLEQQVIFECDTSITQQHELYSFYNDIIFREVQVFAVLAFSYTWRSMNVDFDYTDEMLFEMDQSINRITKYTELFKNKMKISTNVIRRCDPLESHQKDKTYGTFENLSYAFMISEQSFKWKCGKGCDNIPQNSRLCKLQGKNCSADNHEYDDTCPGWAFGCTDSLADQVEVCRRDPDDQSSTKPHYWFKNLDNGFTYGDTSRQCGSTEILGIKRTFWPLNYVCKICLCGCTDNRIHTKTNTTRAFSLLWSETSNNMVATGARLVARDRMIHIQLREGKLLPYGKIDKKTERWIPLPKFEYDDNFPVTAIYSNGTRYSLEQSIDFATIQSTYMDRICLQKLIFNEGQLLTGAKFNVDYLDDDSSIGCIALDVKYGSFEYQHGNITAITNYKKQLPKPNELILNNPDDPLKFKTHPYDSEENKFVYIKESDMTKDASQTTIPFFDLLDVTTDPHVPLSGIELFHKGQVDGTSGGFISLKIYPLNLTIHMDP